MATSPSLRRKLLVSSIGLAAVGYGCDGSTQTLGNAMAIPYEDTGPALGDTGFVVPDVADANADAVPETSDAASVDADAADAHETADSADSGSDAGTDG